MTLLMNFEMAASCVYNMREFPSDAQGCRIVFGVEDTRVSPTSKPVTACDDTRPWDAALHPS